MNTLPITDVARRLIALEAARDGLTGAGGGDAVRVCDKLRVPIAKLAGVAGYRSLLSRAVALAKAKVPALAGVQVRADGTLEGSDRTGGVEIVAQLLALLVTFIGEPLTRTLVRDAWPDESPNGSGAGTGVAT